LGWLGIRADCNPQSDPRRAGPKAPIRAGAIRRGVYWGGPEQVEQVKTELLGFLKNKTFVLKI
jgi:hypothetical protein